ncbi:response regulator [Yoonia sediminilitoris]|uniref:Response regulator receiver domain-containing protein n=1 Tax=Yoonia sediminilitoris TaxID=1286148 RepID=A0A2T6KPI7_9RHOB|nr:response regulator [Yoonia sediminilitoris]PUB18471.1 response regulator receiver domain-containing protein [Yoonia sediminilitoris]RCW98639.1 response regulator receiver domain-containing protein [Yoonia sediminilitoris]
MTQKLSGLKVLIVEDNFLLLDVFKNIFEEARAKVTTAQSLQAGLKLVNESFHAALLDVCLPDGEVYPIADRFAGTGTKIVFLSGFGDVNLAVDRYPNAVALTKPVTADDLVAAIFS